MQQVLRKLSAPKCSLVLYKLGRVVVIFKDSMVRIDVCTGTVYFRAFSRFTVSCHLRYEWYPFDQQVQSTSTKT